MKLTVPQIIDTWHCLDEISALNDHLNPVFSTYMKRFQVKVRPEINFWDSLSDAERISFADTEIDIQISKLQKRSLPEDLPQDRLHQIQRFVNGEIDVEYMPKLKELISNKTKKNKGDSYE